MSSHRQEAVRRLTAPDIAARKGQTPVVCLTAYTAPMAEILDEHCDLLLVGDSLGMVVHGLPNTVGVTLEMMILHGQAVMRGSRRAMVVVDNIAYLVQRGIPVMGHVGLRPQAVMVDGGFKAKGRGQDERRAILDTARATVEAGAFAVVVEGVAEGLAREITEAIAAPTIGIGASAGCDGQILVTDDMLGLFDWTPKFVRRYADLRGEIGKAVAGYADDVRHRRFPGPAEIYFAKAS